MQCTGRALLSHYMILNYWTIGVISVPYPISPGHLFLTQGTSLSSLNPVIL